MLGRHEALGRKNDELVPGPGAAALALTEGQEFMQREKDLSWECAYTTAGPRARGGRRGAGRWVLRARVGGPCPPAGHNGKGPDI